MKMILIVALLFAANIAGKNGYLFTNYVKQVYEFSQTQIANASSEKSK